ncbi:hypothetical protein GPK34_13430 [Secundilactobacillus kimchicus]|uniref:hypothetical protein n=1 Tax=Secundilactobacillus kimchicus TaxID=528209 RepID=UPI001C00C59C|nr:hypothetical protein [Secundilactobacillus kimchicus]MBT9673033.1 hypothetical protein [Secundilactobacillus kimchicus]
MDDRPLAQANQAFKDGDWQTAVQRYEAIYQTRPSAKINHLLARSLMSLGDAAYAFEVVLQAPDSYLSDADHFQFLMTVVLENDQLLMANQIAATVTNSAMKQAANQQINMAEQHHRQQVGFQAAYQAFYQLATESIAGQRERYERGKQLPLKEWLTATQHLLVDPFVTPIIRVTLLQDLQKLRFDKPVRFQWLIGEPREIVPSQLTDFDEQPTVRQVQERLLETLSRRGTDPGLSVALLEGEMVNLTLLYPFIDDVVTSPERWVAAASQSLDGPSKTPGRPKAEDESMTAWRQKLAALTQAMQS